MIKTFLLTGLILASFKALSVEVNLGYCNVFIPSTFDFSVKDDGRNLNFLKTEHIDYLGHKILNSEEVNIYKNMPIEDGIIKNANVFLK